MNFDNATNFLEGKQKALNSLESKIFPTEKEAQGKERPFDLQWLTKYLRLTLVFMWNSAQPERFNFYFSIVLC